MNYNDGVDLVNPKHDLYAETRKSAKRYALGLRFLLGVQPSTMKSANG